MCRYALLWGTLWLLDCRGCRDGSPQGRGNRKGDVVDLIGEVTSGGGLQGRALVGVMSGYVCGG